MLQSEVQSIHSSKESVNIKTRGLASSQIIIYIRSADFLNSLISTKYSDPKSFISIFECICVHVRR